MKEFILKLELHDVKDKRKALKTVSTLPGIDSISMDMKDKKLTVIGTVDPVRVVSKLRKFWTTELLSVGPVKEPKKKEEPKKEEPKKEEPKKEETQEEPKKEETKEEKKEEPKKEDPKKEESKKEEEPKKEEAAEKKPEPVAEPVMGMIMPYRPYYPPMHTYYYPSHNIEENPNACVIC